MIHVFKDRVIYNDELLTANDEGKYITINASDVPQQEGKLTLIQGCNLDTKEIYYEFIDLPPEPKPEPQPTETQILMQALSDMELSSIEAQQERQMLARQVADLELMILERGNV